MCDHCVKRKRAYKALSTEERDAVDTFAESSNAKLGMLNVLDDQEAFETAYVAFGDSLDILLGIATPVVPDSPPADWTDPPAPTWLA